MTSASKTKHVCNAARSGPLFLIKEYLGYALGYPLEYDLGYGLRYGIGLR